MICRIVHDMPSEAYHSSEGVSSHDLGLINHSPAYYKHAKSQPQKPKSHYSIGTLIHTAVLEPDMFEDSFLLAPDCEKRSKVDKETWMLAELKAEHENKVLVNQEDLDEIRRIMDSVLSHKSALEAIQCGGIVEPSLYADDEETGLLLRARPDLVSLGNSIVDLKTTAFDGASRSSFSRSVSKFRYYVQAAFYLDMAERCGIKRDTFVFIAVEKMPPYAVAVYQLDEESINAGRIQYRKDLKTYKEALISGNWGAYSQEIEIISLPEWRIKEAMDISISE